MQEDSIRKRSDELLAEMGSNCVHTIWLTDDIWDRLDRFAEEVGVTTNLVFNELIKDWLDKQDRKSRRRRR